MRKSAISNGHQLTNKKTQATGDHFNLPGHSGVRDMRLQVLEKVFVKSKALRLVREALYIKEFQSEHKGMNRKK